MGIGVNVLGYCSGNLLALHPTIYRNDEDWIKINTDDCVTRNESLSLCYKRFIHDVGIKQRIRPFMANLICMNE